MATNTNKVSFQKLRTGDWGLRSVSELTTGSSVVVTKRDGTQESKTVGSLVWSGSGVWLYTIAGGPSSRANGGRPAYARRRDSAIALSKDPEAQIRYLLQHGGRS